jgi:hypothetical protein
MHKTNIKDIDCIYIASDDPQSQELWAVLQDLSPRARRVHGISDHDRLSMCYAAAQCSSTEEFLLISSNVLPDPEFFDWELDLSQIDPQQETYIWKCRNNINAHIDHDHGINVWSRGYANRVQQTTSHNDHDVMHTIQQVDYDLKFMHDCISTVYINQTPYQAWREGFMSAVKLSLYLNRRPTTIDFRDLLPQHQLDSLSIWHNIGADVENGIWAMAGARQATYMIVLTAWPYQHVNDPNALWELWDSVQNSDPRILAGQIGIELHAELGIPVAMFDAEQSKFFKHHFNSRWINRGVMMLCN